MYNIKIYYYYYIMYNNNNTNKTRTFTIVDFPKDNQEYGKYKSTIPKKAAENAFKTLLKYSNFNSNNEKDLTGKFIVFVLKDIDSKKLYKYIGTIVKLKKPITRRTRNGEEIVYYYKNVIGKYNKELDKI